MDIKGKIILFPERKKTKDGKEFTVCTTSAKGQDADGNPIYKSMRVVFVDREKFSDEKLNKLDPKCYYVLEPENAWIGVETYVNKDSVRETAFVLKIKSGELKEKAEKKEPAKDVRKEELPF